MSNVTTKVVDVTKDFINNNRAVPWAIIHTFPFVNNVIYLKTNPNGNF